MQKNMSHVFVPVLISLMLIHVSDFTEVFGYSCDFLIIIILKNLLTKCKKKVFELQVK